MRRTAASAKREVILPFCVRPSARTYDGVGNGRADGAFHPRRHGGHPDHQRRRLHRRQAQEISGRHAPRRVRPQEHEEHAANSRFCKKGGHPPFLRATIGALSCLGTGQKYDIFSEICPVPKHDILSEFCPVPKCDVNSLQRVATARF